LLERGRAAAMEEVGAMKRREDLTEKIKACMKTNILTGKKDSERNSCGETPPGKRCGSRKGIHTHWTRGKTTPKGGESSEKKRGQKKKTRAVLTEHDLI